jgi:hypothetical protein
MVNFTFSLIYQNRALQQSSDNHAFETVLPVGLHSPQLVGAGTLKDASDIQIQPPPSRGAGGRDKERK